MPLPLIPILIGAGAAALGIGKGAKAIHDNNKANDINQNAQSLIESSKNKLKRARNTTKKSLEELGKKKLEICQNTLTDFVSKFERIKNVELTTSSGLEELERFRIDKANFASLKDITILAGSMIGGTAAGAVAGGAVAFGAYGAASVFATASTGTAIASLSGAAATNATLAFFGGGSLAAGGLGVAGGTMVLGGLVAGPALAVLGFVMGAKASANLDNAYSNYAKAKEASEQVELLVTACKGVKARSDMFKKLLGSLDELLGPMLEELQEIIDSEGVDYKHYSTDTKKFLAALVSTVQAVKAILDTPLLNDNGALTEDSKTVGNGVKNFLGMEQKEEDVKEEALPKEPEPPAKPVKHFNIEVVYWYKDVFGREHEERWQDITVYAHKLTERAIVEELYNIYAGHRTDIKIRLYKYNGREVYLNG